MYARECVHAHAHAVGACTRLTHAHMCMQWCEWYYARGDVRVVRVYARKWNRDRESKWLSYLRLTMCVCICMCVCVYVYVYMCVFVYACQHKLVRLCVYACMRCVCRHYFPPIFPSYNYDVFYYQKPDGRKKSKSDHSFCQQCGTKETYEWRAGPSGS